MENDPAQGIATALNATVDFARTSERIHAALAAVLPLQQAVSRIQPEGEDGPDLSPELLVVGHHIGEVSEALTRAFLFVNASFDVQMDAIQQSLDQEGGHET